MDKSVFAASAEAVDQKMRRLKAQLMGMFSGKSQTPPYFRRSWPQNSCVSK